MHRYTVSLTAGCLVLCLVGDPAGAGVPQVIYSTIGSSPTSDVPGGGGLKFASFDRPVCSQSGLWWAMLARNNGPAASDAMYLTGWENNGFVRVREGVTYIEPDRTAENVSDRRIGINDTGGYAVTLDLGGDPTNDRVVVKGNHSGFGVVYREGDLVGAAIPDAAYGTLLSDVNLTNAGKVSLRANSLAGTLPGQMHALLKNDGQDLAAQVGNAALRPPGQVGTENWLSFTAGSYWVDAAGQTWLTKGDLDGSANTSQVLAVNNEVKIQKGVPMAPFSTNVAGIFAQNMTPSGDWYARGQNTNGVAWVVRNGQVAAASGDLVPGGEPSEEFSNSVWNVSNGSTFFLHTGNSVGDYVIAGFTNLDDPKRNAVWVINGTEVILRSGDQVDLNGDGLLDDAYIAVTGLSGSTLNGKADAGFFTNNYWFYFNADLVDHSGTYLGEAFLRLRVPEPASLILLTVAAGELWRRRRNHGP